MIDRSMQNRRRSPRLKEYDYAKPGSYCVTIVTQNRLCLFGEVVDSTVQLTNAGETIEYWWDKLQSKFANVKLDEFIVMPNHLHGIVTIRDPTVGADLCVGPQQAGTGAHTGAPLPKMVQWFKTITTNEYIRGVRQSEWPPFRNRLWQRSYYDHVIRDEDSLTHIRQYIMDNPARWEFDRENPAVRTVEPETDDETQSIAGSTVFRLI